jgi:hypothetical protein
MASLLSTNENTNLKLNAKAINAYKFLQVTPEDKVLNETTSTVIAYVDEHGEITYITDNNSNRSVSYVVSVSCDSCLAGGPYAGDFSSGAESELLVYGFDAGSNACGSVSGISTELGTTEASADACANAGAEEVCEFFDCSGAEACGYEGWVGDGYCDDGSFGYYFDCAEFDCDGGDCLDTCGVCNGSGETECWDGSLVCDASNCPDECVGGDSSNDGNVNIQDVVIMVNYVLGIQGFDDFDAIACGDLAGCEDENGVACGSDGVINILDITTTVVYILGGGSFGSVHTTKSDIRIVDNRLSIDTDGCVSGVQLTLDHDSNVVVNLNDYYISEYNTADNTTRIVVVSENCITDIGTIDGDYDVTDYLMSNSSGNQLDGKVVTVSSFAVKVSGANPFNPTTTLNVAVPEAGHVSVTIYNLVGQQVASLYDGYMDASSNGHNLTWNASNLASGVYFVKAENAGQVSYEKLMLLK